MFGVQERQIRESVFLWGSWGGCGESVMDMELGAADRRPVVCAASVRSPSASDRKDLVGVATAPTPFLNEPWKYKDQTETTKKKEQGGQIKITVCPHFLKHTTMGFKRSFVIHKWGRHLKVTETSHLCMNGDHSASLWQPAAKYTWEKNLLLQGSSVWSNKNILPHTQAHFPLNFWVNHSNKIELTKTGSQCGGGCHWCHAPGPPSNCRRSPTPAVSEPALHPDPHHHLQE